MGNQETDITNEKFSNLKYKASTRAKNNYNILVIKKHLEKYKYCISSNWCTGTSLKFSEKEGSWSLYSSKKVREEWGGAHLTLQWVLIQGRLRIRAWALIQGTQYVISNIHERCFTTKAGVELISLHQIRHKPLASMCTYY